MSEPELPLRDFHWREKLRYRFENTLSKGPGVMIGYLALASLIVVSIAGLVLAVFGVNQTTAPGAENFGLIEGIWHSLMRALDPGNLGGDEGWWLRIVMLLVTLFGIFVVSILIGTITSGLEANLSELRKGRSKVLESNHTLILGFSSKVYSIIGELLIANENQTNPSIVILADRDKVEMEDEIRAKFPDLKNTRVICRRGSPIDLDHLRLAQPNSARSIIVLAPESEMPDIYVIKTVLALTNNPERKAGKYHIVAEIDDTRNLEAAELVGRDEAIFVQSDDLIARVTAQTCRQSGLSVVYTELLDFDGAEIYFKEEPSLVGSSYREVIMRFETSTIMGFARADGSVLINPPMDTKLAKGDQVIAISEDDDTIVLSQYKYPPIEESAISIKSAPEASPERTLVLGWNRRGETIVRELDSYVAPGSEVVVTTENEGDRAQLMSLAGQLTRQRLRYAKGELTTRALLEALKPQTFDHIIVLSDTNLEIQQADARTLITLLHLRKIADQTKTRMKIVSEMQDMRNRQLAQIARADDFIVSDKLVSLMLSQLSENKMLDRVFKTLFASEGSEIYIRPVSQYVRTGMMMKFVTVVEAAARRNETAIGFRKLSLADDKNAGFGVKVNPGKMEEVFFDAGDQIIVLAEE
jgi:ion channel POLLUX/CASTOR